MRTPVYILIDHSASVRESMIYAQSNALDVLLEDLLQDQNQDSWVSMVAFNSEVELIQPLRHIDEVIAPPPTRGSGATDLGMGLFYICSQTTELATSSDWLKPKLVIFTDGDLDTGLQEEHWQSARLRFDKIILCAQNKLNQYSPYIDLLMFDQLRAGTFLSRLK